MIRFLLLSVGLLVSLHNTHAMHRALLDNPYKKTLALAGVISCSIYCCYTLLTSASEMEDTQQSAPVKESTPILDLALEREDRFAETTTSLVNRPLSTQVAADLYVDAYGFCRQP